MASAKQRYVFIDQFRGLVGIMMALGHSSGFFNSIWKSLDMFDPLFSNPGQFWLRYMGYLCAPGFLMMNGAVSWLTYQRRIAAGCSRWQAKWHLIKRGLFLIAVQVVVVNSAWIGFRALNLAHFGIIGCIGTSMCILALFVNAPWWVRLAIGAGVSLAQPFLLTIRYDANVTWQRILMQTWIDAGEWNKYPVLPWFSLATLGSVMATGWLSAWKKARQRILWSWAVAAVSVALAIAVRMNRGWGNTFPFDEFGRYSFVLDQKYPPNLFHNLWFFGAVCFFVGLVDLIGQFAMPLVSWLGIVGRVPLFFYVVHISLLSIVADRFGVYYRQGGVLASFVGWVALLAVMLPLSVWFRGVKERSKNPIIALI